MHAYSSNLGGDGLTLPAAQDAGRQPRRWVEWVVVAVAIGLVWPLWSWRGKVNQAGLVVDETITLITSDRENLSCALGRPVGRYACAFQAPNRPRPGQIARADLLAPYVAGERRTLLVPGLFEQPAIAARYAAEPPANLPREALQRFAVRCKLRL